MIRKMDYARVYELILTELSEGGHDNMVEWLTENPPKTYNGRLFSVDLAESLVEAKEKMGGEFSVKLSTLDSIRNYSNLRLMLDKHDEGEWFEQLKAVMPAKVKQKIKQKVKTKPPKTLTETDLFGDPDDDNDPCECDAEECELRAVWKCKTHCSRKVCGKHMLEEGRREHDYTPWDCDTDKFYDYIEDIPGAAF